LTHGELRLHLCPDLAVGWRSTMVGGEEATGSGAGAGADTNPLTLQLDAQVTPGNGGRARECRIMSRHSLTFESRFRVWGRGFRV
jgi:hypothetical protein